MMVCRKFLIAYDEVMTLHADITTYNSQQETSRQDICNILAEIIDENLPHAENKVWHGHPVWFLDGNPVVGYAVRKQNVQLLFWSGQSFDEPGLEVEGTFKAAQKRYDSVEEIGETELKRWLQKAQDIQWDYKNIVKRKGKLERLK
jgi:hypothetical protein